MYSPATPTPRRLYVYILFIFFSTFYALLEGNLSTEEVTDQLCEEMNQRRMFVYSAHDHNLAAILASFGLKTNAGKEWMPWPRTASAILIELWQRRQSKPTGETDRKKLRTMFKRWQDRTVFSREGAENLLEQSAEERKLKFDDNDFYLKVGAPKLCPNPKLPAINSKF